MSGPEALLWQQLKAVAKSKRCYAERLENSIGSGLPDVLFVGPSQRVLLIELKVSTNDTIRLRNKQYSWWHRFGSQFNREFSDAIPLYLLAKTPRGFIVVTAQDLLIQFPKSSTNTHVSFDLLSFQAFKRLEEAVSKLTD